MTNDPTEYKSLLDNEILGFLDLAVGSKSFDIPRFRITTEKDVEIFLYLSMEDMSFLESWVNFYKHCTWSLDRIKRMD